MNIRLSGFLTGDIWMPQTRCALPITADLVRERARITPRATIAETVQMVITEKGGDFQNALLHPDSEIIFDYRRHVGPGRYVYRVKTCRVADVKSLSDWVDPDDSLPDFGEE